MKTHSKKSEYASTSDDICKESLWIPNPFANHSDIKLLPLEEDQLIELTSNRTLEITFRQKFLSAFWISIRNDYSSLSEKILKLLVSFSLICEKWDFGYG
jgi:hypothetical protein